MLVMEKIMRVPIQEIAAFRFTCQHCDGVMELRLDQLVNATLVCPGCGSECRRPDVDGAMRSLESSLQTLAKGGNGRVDLEFVVKLP